MADYLMRDDAPIGADVWAKIDDMVMTVAGKLLVGRRLLSMVGPLGWGVEQAPLFGFEKQGDAAVAKAAKYVALGELSQEFVLRAKQLVMAEQTSFALDLGAVAIAATALAKAEDKAIVGGLLKQATPAALGDWGVMGGPFAAVADAVAGLRLAASTTLHPGAGPGPVCQTGQPDAHRPPRDRDGARTGGRRHPTMGRYAGGSGAGGQRGLLERGHGGGPGYCHRLAGQRRVGSALPHL